MKKILIYLAAIALYCIGMVCYAEYSDRPNLDFEKIALLVVAVILITGPVINYWEAKLRKLFGLDQDKTQKEESN